MADQLARGPIRQAVRLALGTAVALGLARFAYGLLVPVMREELDWSLSTAGMSATANGLGYLAGALMTPPITRRIGAAALFRLGMVATAAALAASAVGTDPLMLLATRALAGVAGACVFVSGGVLAAHLAGRAGSGTPITIYFAGTGLGVLLSGAALPIAGNHWRAAWVGLGIAAALATTAAWSAAQDGRPASAAPESAGGIRLRPLRPTVVAYFLFAAGYITYITFLSVHLTERGAPTGWVIATWAVVGVAIMIAPLLWRRPIARLPGNRMLAVLLAVLACGAGLSLIASPLAMLASAGMYGATFMTVPAIVTALVKATTAASEWTGTLAACTAVFAAGQTVGPWSAGLLADRAGAEAAVVWTALLCAAAALVAATQRLTDPPPVQEKNRGDVRIDPRPVPRRLVLRATDRTAARTRPPGAAADPDRCR